METKTQKIFNFLRKWGYNVVFESDITETEDGSISFEDHSFISVGVGINYYTVLIEYHGNNFRLYTVENKRELLEKIQEFLE